MHKFPSHRILLPDCSLSPELARKAKAGGWAVGRKRNGAMLLIRKGDRTRQFASEAAALAYIDRMFPPSPPAASSPP